MEEWRDVPGYEGLYMVSNMGEVKSIFYHKGIILKSSAIKSGHSGVTLCKNGIRTRLSVHRIIAEAFIPNPDNLPQVNHKDENPRNNCVENLEWCTVKYNANYGTRNSRISKQMLNNPKISKSIVQLDKKNNIVCMYPSAAETDRQTGIGRQNIIHCCLRDGHRKTAGGYKWEYAENIHPFVLRLMKDVYWLS